MKRGLLTWGTPCFYSEWSSSSSAGSYSTGSSWTQRTLGVDLAAESSCRTMIDFGRFYWTWACRVHLRSIQASAELSDYWGSLWLPSRFSFLSWRGGYAERCASLQPGEANSLHGPQLKAPLPESFQVRFPSIWSQSKLSRFEGHCSRSTASSLNCEWSWTSSWSCCESDVGSVLANYGPEGV